MGILDWVRSALGREPSAKDTPAASDDAPSAADWTAADAALKAALRPVIYGSIGGVRPDPSNRATSWWGSNFLGASGEDVPTGSDGQPMDPLLQIRTDELAETLAGWEGIALLTLWLDRKASFWEGSGFVIRTYASLEGLVPIGPGYREDGLFPSFPILWSAPQPEQPGWENMADRVPGPVARARKDGWFFETEALKACNAMQTTHPVKLGGWPTWIQGDQWPEDATFLFQVDSTDKGKLPLGDAGSIYFFRDAGGWILRADCY